MPKIKFKIVTPEKVVYEKEVDQVTLPTQKGEITVLPNHIPLVSILQAGELVVKEGDTETPMAISSGFVEVRKNEVLVLTQTAEHAAEIDEAKALQAKERAEQLMKEIKNKDAVEYAGLAAKLEKELARLKVVRKRKHTNQPNIQSQ